MNERVDPALEDIRIVAHANSLAHDFFRGIYGESATVPGAALYEFHAYPCWALACHAYQELLGVDPRESLARLVGRQQPATPWIDSTPRGDFSFLQDEHITLPPGYTNGQWAWTTPSWEAEVIENARRIERECS